MSNRLDAVLFRVVGHIAWLMVLFAPGALAAGEASQAHTIVEAGASQGTALGSSWAFHPSYSVSLLSLGDSGQGFGARLTLLPPSSDRAWELSADAVARWANESPWYLKGIGGVAVASPGAGWPPRLRAGAEIGLTAIRGGIGLEAGIGAVVSVPPLRPAEGEVGVYLGMGILFGFGTSSPTLGASCREDRPGEPHRTSSSDSPGSASRSSPVVGAVLAASPAGGFNTCEGSRATPQCLQAMSQSEGAASTSSTSPPASGAVTPTEIPAGGATSSTAPNTAPARLSGWKTAATAAASLGAALGLKSDEQRAREAEHDRLMEESARTLEELKRQRAHAGSEGSAQRFELPGQRAEQPIRDPGGSAAPRVDSQNHAPRSAPGASNGRAIAEPDGELQAPLSLHNPYGQHGKPDHQATVRRLEKLAEREFPNADIETGTSIFKETGVNRRPDVWVRDTETRKVLKVYEAVRLNPDGSLPRREQLKKNEYDHAGVPSHFEPVTP